MILSMLANHPKMEVLYNPLLLQARHLFVYIGDAWMIMHLPKLDLLYNPLLDESERVSKSSEIGCFV